jgi:hypothetical protein
MAVSARIYNTLLRLYPPPFRKEFASDMALDFADASDEAWRHAGWIGLFALWSRVAVDFTGSIAVQWLRTGIPLLALLAMSGAVLSASAALRIAPTMTSMFIAQLSERDTEIGILMLMAATVFLIIAATIIFNLCFLRPMLRKKRL